jgi:hypothetical protein
MELNPSLDAALSRPKNGCCYTVSQLSYYRRAHDGHHGLQSLLAGSGIALGCVVAILALIYLINFPVL